VARRGDELDAEAAEIEHDGVEDVDLDLTAVAPAGADLAEFEGAAEQASRLAVERAGERHLAAVEDEQGRLVPGLAQPAIQGGRHAARQILRTLRGEAREPFHYFDKGTLATIGRNAAVAQIGRLRSEGFFAWLLWLLVHIVMLIGFRNRVLVLAQWAWTYLRYERGARLITGEVPELLCQGSARPAE